MKIRERFTYKTNNTTQPLSKTEIKCRTKSMQKNKCVFGSGRTIKLFTVVHLVNAANFVWRSGVRGSDIKKDQLAGNGGHWCRVCHLWFSYRLIKISCNKHAITIKNCGGSTVAVPLFHSLRSLKSVQPFCITASCFIPLIEMSHIAGYHEIMQSSLSHRLNKTFATVWWSWLVDRRVEDKQ